MRLLRYCPNPYNSRLNFIGGIALLLFGQFPLLRALSVDSGDWILMTVPYVLLNAAGILLLTVSTDRIDFGGSKLRTTRRVAGVLFFVGMFSLSVLEYLTNPEPRAVFYILRWIIPAVVLIALFFYSTEE
jgi:quinol-cytochrome oxidoreductase complex cytochrome b subunit